MPSAIEWTEETWNPIVGCTIVSPGCTNCYAMRMAARLEAMGVAHYAGLTQPGKAGPVWTGKVAMAPDKVLTAPLRRRKPTTYFVNSMGDLFHEDVPDAWIDRVFAVMALCPQHTFQVLTKRSARMRAYFDAGLSAHGTPNRLIAIEDAMHTPGKSGVPTVKAWPLPNVWLGVSAEDQRRADERIPDLLATPATIRFVSAEPLLGPIDLRRLFATNDHGFGGYFDAMAGTWRPGDLAEHARPIGSRLDWVITGDESGPHRRGTNLNHFRGLRDQCAAAGTPFFLKQRHIAGRKHSLPPLDGRTHDTMPERAA